MSWGAILKAAAPYFSGGLEATGQIYAANKSASTAKKINQQQIDYNKEAAQNAHQWEVEDLKKAGLNPILSANSGASVNAMSPIMPDTSGYANAISSGADVVKKLGADTENQTKIANATAQQAESTSAKNYADALETTEKTKWIEPQAKAEIKNKSTSSAKNLADAAQAQSQIKLNETTQQLQQQQIASIAIDNEIKRIKAEINKSDFGKALAYIDRLMETVANGGEAFQKYSGGIAALRNAATNKDKAGANTVIEELNKTANGYRRKTKRTK